MRTELPPMSGICLRFIQTCRQCELGITFTEEKKPLRHFKISSFVYAFNTALSFTQWTILRCRWVIFSLKFEWERLYPVYSRSLIWDCCWFSLVMCNFPAVPFGLGNTEAWLSDRPCNSQLILVMLHCIKLCVFRHYWDPLNPYFCIRLLLLLCSAQLLYPNWDLLNKTK